MSNQPAGNTPDTHARKRELRKQGMRKRAARSLEGAVGGMGAAVAAVAALGRGVVDYGQVCIVERY